MWNEVQPGIWTGKLTPSATSSGIITLDARDHYAWRVVRFELGTVSQHSGKTSRLTLAKRLCEAFLKGAK